MSAMKTVLVKSDPGADDLSDSLYPTDIEIKVEPGDSSFNVDSNEVVAEVKAEPESDDGPDNLYPTDIELNLEPESRSVSTHCNKDSEVTGEPGDSSINIDCDEGVAEMRTEPGSDGGADHLSPTGKDCGQKSFQRDQNVVSGRLLCPNAVKRKIKGLTARKPLQFCSLP
ncbi:uncharacterized protein [Watersipora subatra]|uniref:uncharacterized protein n=1 Tax=Watersipora subatra TaxID=2589382 RepID=UPI00355B9B2B